MPFSNVFKNLWSN